MLACAAMLAGALSGCGKRDTGGSVATQQTKGRWVETRQELPEGLEAWEPRQIFSVDGEIHLLASKNEDDRMVFSEWAAQEETFTDVTQSWLASVELPCGEAVGVMLAQSGDGTQYLAARYALPEDTSYRSCLWKSGAGQARDITPEKWTILNEEWGMYESLRGIAALEDGSLFALTYTSMDLLSGEDGNVLESEEGPSMGGAMLAAVACGAYASVEEIAEKLVKVVDTVEPEPELAEKYEVRYRQFRKIYPACKELFNEIIYKRRRIRKEKG